LVLDEFDKLWNWASMMIWIYLNKRTFSRILTSATAMDEIPAFTGLKDEK
jgi:hypothetical protein